MSVYKKQTVVKSFPAYNIAEREDDSNGHINFTANEVVGIECNGFYRQYTFGSAVSYALKNNQDPIRSYERCVELGHQTHWLNQNSVSITSHPRDKWTVVKISVGQKVKFEGKVFEINTAPNDNLVLREVVTVVEPA